VATSWVPARSRALAELFERHAGHPGLAGALREVWRTLEAQRELGSLVRVREPLAAALAPAGPTAPGAARPAGPTEEALVGELATAYAAGAPADRGLLGRRGPGGAALVQLLARRYDVVATNPPYLGSRHLGRGSRTT